MLMHEDACVCVCDMYIQRMFHRCGYTRAPTRQRFRLATHMMTFCCDKKTLPTPLGLCHSCAVTVPSNTFHLKLSIRSLSVRSPRDVTTLSGFASRRGPSHAKTSHALVHVWHRLSEIWHREVTTVVYFTFYHGLLLCVRLKP